jgi:hypothetical protein
MVVKIRKIIAKGDEQHLLSLEEAAKLIDARARTTLEQLDIGWIA